MKKLILSTTMLLAILLVFAQDDKSKRPSPPAKAMGEAGSASITIDYSQPSVKKRKIFGGLEPYGKVWRAGANETTIIEFSADVMIDGKTVPKGKYGLYVIPNENEWTVIINTGIAWGAYSYKESEDVLRVNVPVEKTDLVEKLTYEVKDGMVSLAWEYSKVNFEVK